QRAARPRIGKADAASRRQHTLGGERGVAGKREVRSIGGRTATAPSTASVCIDVLFGGGVQIGGGIASQRDETAGLVDRHGFGPGAAVRRNLEMEIVVAREADFGAAGETILEQ